MTALPETGTPWTPDQALRADATDEQIMGRWAHLNRTALRAANPRQPLSEFSAIAVAREFAAACVASAGAPKAMCGRCLTVLGDYPLADGAHTCKLRNAGFVEAGAGEPEQPYAWVIPGDDTAREGGWIDARIDQQGEFSLPLYRHPAVSPAGTGKAVDALTKDFVLRDAHDPKSGTTLRGVIDHGHWRCLTPLECLLIDAIPSPAPSGAAGTVTPTQDDVGLRGRFDTILRLLEQEEISRAKARELLHTGDWPDDSVLERLNWHDAAAPLPVAGPTEWRVGEEDDELVFGDFHMERMSDGHIWFSVGGASFDLAVKGGRGKLVWNVQNPGGWQGIAKDFEAAALPRSRSEDGERTP